MAWCDRAGAAPLPASPATVATFDLATPHGRMMATVLAGIAEFERELIQERIRSGIAAAKRAASNWAANLGSDQNPTDWRRKSWHSSQRDAAIA